MSDLDPNHETAVEDFMEGLRKQDPARVAAIEERYPVLTEAELDWRRSKEVHLSEVFANTLELSADLHGRRVTFPVELRRTGRPTAIAA